MLYTRCTCPGLLKLSDLNYIQCGGKANKNGVEVEELFLKFVLCLSHMIEQVYWLNNSYWLILNLHAIFVHLSPALDINYYIRIDIGWGFFLAGYHMHGEPILAALSQFL